MLTVPRAVALCLAAAAFLAIAAFSAPGAPGQQGPLATTRIEHLVVIQVENWSFDSLFGGFPGVDGLTPGPGTPTPLPQTDKAGRVLPGIAGPDPICGNPTPTAVPPRCFPPTLSPVPYDFATYIDPYRQPPPDTIHEFFREQFQINHGRMDRFAAWNDVTPAPSVAPEFFAGAVLGHFDLSAVTTATPSIAHYARQYTIADKFHHPIFGASVPNWFGLICACVLIWPSPPPSQQIQVTLTVTPPTPPVIVNTGPSAALLPNPAGTPIWYVVDNPPRPEDGGPPLQDLPTIGDRLDAKGVSWAWYWDAPEGVENFPAPWIWFRRYATHTTGYATHVIGGTVPPTTATPTGTPVTATPGGPTGTPTAPILKGPDIFLTAVKANTIPQVSFVQPGTALSLHPDASIFPDGDGYLAERLIGSIVRSDLYRQNKVAIVVVFDENGGRWDHVPPPHGIPYLTDQFGPGSRIPVVIVSPWARRCYVDHTYYDSTAILSFIEKNWNLTPVATRDAVGNPLSGAFDFNSTPLPPGVCPTVTATSTSTPPSTLTATRSPTLTIHPLTQTAIALTGTATPTIHPLTQTAIAQTATIQALTATATPTIHPLTQTAVAQTATIQALTATITPTIHPLTLTAIALTPTTTSTPVRAPTTAPNGPITSGTPGVSAATTVGQTITYSSGGNPNGVSGTWTKTGSGRFAFLATNASAAIVPGSISALTLPTTAGNESGTPLAGQATVCTPVGTTAPFTTTCQRTTIGDVLLGATVTVTFATVGGGTALSTGSQVAGATAITPAAPVSIRPVAIVPLLPPLPPIVPPVPPLGPPLPPALLPPLPAALLGPSGPLGPPPDAAAAVGVPVIPEAESGALLVMGLLGLGVLASWRRRARG